MKKKYRKISIWEETYQNFKKKQSNVSQTVTDLTGKKRSIPFTAFLDKISNKPMWFEHQEMIRLTKRGRKI